MEALNVISLGYSMSKKKIIKEVSWLFDTNLKYIGCKFNLHGDSDLLNVKKVSVPILGSDKSKLVEWLIRDIFRERDRKERERKVERGREKGVIVDNKFF